MFKQFRTIVVTLVALTVSAATASAQQDDLRHRLTYSIQWGVDNSFSGKMIESATGETTSGAPINLTETSFDDVYGRMGLFKAGVGYRLNPRTDVVGNLVISRSGAEMVQVGTAGTSNIGTDTTFNTPLIVQFDDFNYWGLEGGQRFYFKREHFTPYAGYLLGLSRYGDITGKFVGVPPEATPGLAAQDGKFFEKSWAFSLGPTGGVMVPVGPIELMGEVQLRFMGGLSDVDWLVEEGLRDINSQSSRWSLPILIGARFRF